MQSQPAEHTQEMFFNRTGILIKPDLSAEMIQGAKEFVRQAHEDGAEAAPLRADYAREAMPIGSYPALIDAGKSAEPERLMLLLDKLGERLAFERQGSRLYQTLVQKVEAIPAPDERGPSSQDLRHICDEELEHFRLLQKSITALGGDATVMTPSADVIGVISHGVLEVVCDPRTTLAQALQAVLTAELADNDGWQMLQLLAAELGYTDLEAQCNKAIGHEQEHLENVRGWLAAMTLNEAAGIEVRDESGSGSGDSEPGQKKPARKQTQRSSKRTQSNRRRKRK
jgi:hypothetical protein